MQLGDVSARGLRLRYRRQGDGEATIVFVHGNSAGKDVFSRQFEHFSGGKISLLALDLPGHGGSDNAIAAEETYTIPGYADVVGDAVAALGVGSHIIAGWSLGGHIALELAGRDAASPKDRFKGLAIFGAPPVGPGMTNVERAFLPATFESATQEAAPPDALLEAYARAVYGSLDPLPEAFIDLARRTDGIAREIMVRHWMTGTDGIDQATTAATWEKPICVLHGGRDAFVAGDYLKTIPWKNLWRGQVFDFPACGHAPFIEDAAAFNRILELFASDVL